MNLETIMLLAYLALAFSFTVWIVAGGRQATGRRANVSEQERMLSLAATFYTRQQKNRRKS